MKRHIIISLCLLFSGIFAGKSQDTLGIGGTGIYSISTVAQYNDSDSINVFVKNKGNSAFSGTVTVFLAVDTSNGLNILTTDTFSVSGFNPGDSTSVSFTYTYTPANFRLGTNIVVIWPQAAGAVTLDSAQATVTINGYNSVIEIDNKGNIQVFPNPSVEMLNIQPDAATINQIKQIQLYDLNGKLIEEYPASANQINMSKYPAATYLLTIRLLDNTVKNYKLIRE